MPAHRAYKGRQVPCQQGPRFTNATGPGRKSGMMQIKIPRQRRKAALAHYAGAAAESALMSAGLLAVAAAATVHAIAEQRGLHQ